MHYHCSKSAAVLFLRLDKMVISGPVIGYVWLVVFLCMYVTIFIVVAYIDRPWRSEHPEYADLVHFTKTVSLAAAIVLAIPGIAAVIVAGSDVYYTLASPWLYVLIASVLSSIGTFVLWGWMIRLQWRHYKKSLTAPGESSTIQE